MSQKKKPTGVAWEQFVSLWHESNHEGKVKLCFDCGVGYETGRHWISDNQEGKPQVKEYKLSLPPTPMETYPNTPTRVTLGKEFTRVAVIGDLHIPYHDAETLEAVNSFLIEQQPDYLIYNGDISDFYQVSEFAKDPSRLGCLQNDIDAVKALISFHHDSMPNTKKILIEGTHENRWVKYLQMKAPAVSKLTAVTVPNLYDLTRYDTQFVPFERGLILNDTFMILHGDLVSAHSSYTAKRQYEKHGGNGICNHTHRGGSYYKRDHFGTWGWWENFCLCRLDPDWILNPDWVQGFSMVTFEDKRFWVEQIPIIHHKFIYGGKCYG